MEFTAEVKGAWEFVCDSKEVAEEWKHAILSAVRFRQISMDNTAITVELAGRQEGEGQGNALNVQVGQQVPLVNDNQLLA